MQGLGQILWFRVQGGLARASGGPVPIPRDIFESIAEKESFRIYMEDQRRVELDFTFRGGRLLLGRGGSLLLGGS